MANIFATDVQKQAFTDGVQDENRAAIPMASVSDVDTENLEIMNNRYGSDHVADSTSDGTYTVTDFTMSNDSLTISNQAVYGERIQTKDLVHAGDAWDIVNDRIDRHSRGLGVVVHRDTYTTTVAGAGLVLDNEVLAGNPAAGTPITMSASNPDDVATKVYALMQDAGVAASQGRPYFMIDPSTARFFKLFGMGAGFNVADRQIMKGFEILPTFDFDYIITPEIQHEQVLTFTDVNVATKTVTIKGVTFLSKATPSVAGDVDVHATTEEGAATNYAAAINNSEGLAAGVTGTLYTELSAANRLILKNANVIATVVGATVVVKAFGAIAGTEDETNATWGTEQKNLLAGLRNSTHLALPSKGFFIDEISQVPGFTGSELRSTQIYDSVIWTKNAPKICKILVDA